MKFRIVVSKSSERSMTGPGEGIHHGSPEKPVPEQPLESEDCFSGPSPLGSLEALRNSQSQAGNNIPAPMTNRPFDQEESGCSVFDDDDEPEGLLGDLPNAIPNVSDGGTDILKPGRAEFQEFHEKFLKQDTEGKADSDSGPKES